MTDAGDYGGSARARSGLGQAETGVQARAKMRRAMAGQRHWRLSRAGRNSGSGSDGGDGGWKAQGTAAAVTTAAAEAGTQGFVGTAEEGRGNEKCEC